ncbi:MAG: replication protein [Ruminococcus sp.]|nr:replication protein [Ruminococcus sp.]
MAEKKKAAARYRNFVTVVYPDSAPENWMQLLAEQVVPAFISPLHDKDVNPTGEPKKPHYHVMIMFEGKKSLEQAKEIFDIVNGVGLEKVNSLRGYARYLCHLDNPEKHQYPIDEVQSLAGADYINTIGLATDKYDAISSMIDFCEIYDVYSYRELLIYCMNNRSDWYRILCDSGTYVIREYLKSRHWDSREGRDCLTGIDKIGKVEKPDES